MRATKAMLLRFLLAFWCGAATLYVATSVREVTSDQLSDAAKSVLPVLRFPLFYGFGFTCLTASLMLVVTTRSSRLIGRFQRRCMLVSLVAVLIAMASDFIFIYPDLRTMLRDGITDPNRFRMYHEASKWINMGELFVCYVCGIIACWSTDER